MQSEERSEYEKTRDGGKGSIILQILENGTLQVGVSKY